MMKRIVTHPESFF